MYINANILNKILVNLMQRYIKMIIHYGLVGFFPGPGLEQLFNICKSSNVIHNINKSKNENHMITSIDRVKIFDEILHQLMIKILIKVGIDGTYLNILKAIDVKLRANIILHCKKFRFSSKIRNKTSMSTLTTSS